MKLLLLFALCILSLCTWAQRDNNNTWRLNPEVLNRFKGNNDSLHNQMQNSFQRKGDPNNLLSSIHGNVATLPQDHMPCIVPDTKNIAAIPNVWKGVSVPYRSQSRPIPNPALPKDSIKYNALHPPTK